MTRRMFRGKKEREKREHKNIKNDWKKFCWMTDKPTDQLSFILDVWISLKLKWSYYVLLSMKTKNPRTMGNLILISKFVIEYTIFFKKLVVFWLKRNWQKKLPDNHSTVICYEADYSLMCCYCMYLRFYLYIQIIQNLFNGPS